MGQNIKLIVVPLRCYFFSPCLHPLEIIQFIVVHCLVLKREKFGLSIYEYALLWKRKKWELFLLRFLAGTSLDLLALTMGATLSL